MKQYMLFIREDLEAMKKQSADQADLAIQQMMGWVEMLSKSGNFVSGEPLDAEYRFARKDSITHDGPYIESKEAISGYMIITAENIDQALELAQSCPLLGDAVQSLEVRPIMQY